MLLQRILNHCKNCIHCGGTNLLYTVGCKFVVISINLQHNCNKMHTWDFVIFSCETVFFYAGKVFCLRGGVEQRGLKVSQFQRHYSPDHYIYIENGSKNNSGANLKIQNKVVSVYANPSSDERCLVALLDKYLSKLPPVAFEKDVFYMKPRTATPSDADSPWYDCWKRDTSYHAGKDV